MNAHAIPFPGNDSLGMALAAGCGATQGRLRWRRFPDRESLVTLEGDCSGRDVFFVCSLCDPDVLALPLLFAARTARELGARSVGLVAPYLAYLRQDANFHAGEAISSVHYAAFLSWAFDWLVTVDPHLHRHSNLASLFSVPAQHISTMPLISEWIAAHVSEPVLIGPDSESAQWVGPVAHALNAPLLVLSKQRRGDREVEISLPDAGAISGRTPVLVDDIVSSGHTLLESLAALGRAGARPAVCIAVHGLFAEDAQERILHAGAARLVSTNTVAHATNAIDISPALLPALRQQLAAVPDARVRPDAQSRPFG